MDNFNIFASIGTSFAAKSDATYEAAQEHAKEILVENAKSCA